MTSTAQDQRPQRQPYSAVPDDGDTLAQRRTAQVMVRSLGIDAALDLCRRHDWHDIVAEIRAAQRLCH